MEKKKYIKPEITVVKIDGDCRILAGSGDGEINKGAEYKYDEYGEYVD